MSGGAHLSTTSTNRPLPPPGTSSRVWRGGVWQRLAGHQTSTHANTHTHASFTHTDPATHAWITSNVHRPFFFQRSYHPHSFNTWRKNVTSSLIDSSSRRSQPIDRCRKPSVRSVDLFIAKWLREIYWSS